MYEHTTWGFVQAWQDFVMYFQMHFLSQIMRNVLKSAFPLPLTPENIMNS